MNDEISKESGGQDFSALEFVSNLSNRMYARFLISPHDFESQLLAIKGALRRNKQADADVAKRIKKLEKQARAHDRDKDQIQTSSIGAWDYWSDQIYHTIFQDAAHSMAAVGMLAPFVESLFVVIFSGLRDAGQGNDKDSHDDPRTAAYENEFWDPHNVFGSKGHRIDLVVGIRQLARTTGLSKYLPADYDIMLSALFAYRNKMFHHGFEWPVAERTKFGERIRSETWPDEWFRIQELPYSEDSRIFYMSREFIQHCLTTIDQILEGIGAYRKQQSIDSVKRAKA